MLPSIDRRARVNRDIDRLLAFVGQQPYGDPEARRQDIERGIQQIAAAPLWNPIGSSDLERSPALRRLNVAQFAIIYRYFPPTPNNPAGVVSIRAVRHARVRNVLHGVRETLRIAYQVDPKLLPA